MQEIVKEIRDVLSEVKYPGTSKSIVALDMVQFMQKDQFRFFCCIGSLRQTGDLILFAHSYGKRSFDRAAVPESDRDIQSHFFF